MGDAIEQCRFYLGFTEDTDSFDNGQVGGDDQRGLFVELSDELEQQGAAGRREWQIPQFIEDHRVSLDQLAGHVSSTCRLLFPLQLVHQIDRVVEANAFAAIDGGHT